MGEDATAGAVRDLTTRRADEQVSRPARLRDELGHSVAAAAAAAGGAQQIADIDEGGLSPCTIKKDGGFTFRDIDVGFGSTCQ